MNYFMRDFAKTHLAFIIFLVSPLTPTSVIASDNPFAWDLSYAIVFKANDVPENDTMLKYFNDAYHRKGNLRKMALSDELFAEINLASIKKAILIDYQAFWYMGHRSSTLYLDDGELVVARTYNSKSNEVRYYKIQPAHFAEFSTAIMHRNQSVPLGGYTFQVAEGYSYAGYIGVISSYSSGGPMQQLITIEDFFDRQMETGELGKLINRMQKRMILLDVEN